MNEQIKTNRQNQSENKQEANAAAFAYNKNYNILYVPSSNNDDGGFGTEAQRAPGKGDYVNPVKDNFDNFMKRFGDEDSEYKVESKSTGKAKIQNVNLNFIITQ